MEQCGGKNCYTKHEAERVQGETGRHIGKDLRVYHCPKCFNFHLTKRRSKY